MDRRLFLKDLGLLGLGALLLPKGRSMVGWTQSLESAIWLPNPYAHDLSFMVTREMLEDSWWVQHTFNKMNDPASAIAEMNWQQIAMKNKWFHGETSKAGLVQIMDENSKYLIIPPHHRDA